MEIDRLRYSKVKGVVLDTNMLLVPYYFGVDVLEEIGRIVPGTKVYVIPQVLKELDKLEREGNQRERLGARIGKRIAEKLEVLPVEEGLPTDAALVELAKKGYVIATNDRELKRRIWEAGGVVAYLREKNHLEVG